MATKDQVKRKRKTCYISMTDGKRRVPAWPSVNPYIAVTPWLYREVQRPGWYMVTHIPTGMTIARDIRTIRLARKIAAILSGIPVGWETITPRSARARLAKLPPALRVWMLRVSSGKLDTL